MARGKEKILTPHIARLWARDMRLRMTGGWTMGYGSFCPAFLNVHTLGGTSAKREVDIA